MANNPAPPPSPYVERLLGSGLNIVCSTASSELGLLGMHLTGYGCGGSTATASIRTFAIAYGGIAAAKSVKDMAALAGKYFDGKANVTGLEEFTASYQAPFFESDALQFDTTVDHVDGNDVYLSTRIYRFDTKGYNPAKPDERNRQVEGPVILVNGRFKLDRPFTPAVLQSTDPEDGQKRQEDAIAWAEAIRQ